MVKTLRCGRSNPGSNPGLNRSIFLFYESFLVAGMVIALGSYPKGTRIKTSSCLVSLLLNNMNTVL